MVCIYYFSDGADTIADSDVFPEVLTMEGDEERNGDFYTTPASPTTVPYCPRPPSTGMYIHIKCANVHLFIMHCNFCILKVPEKCNIDKLNCTIIFCITS